MANTQKTVEFRGKKSESENLGKIPREFFHLYRLVSDYLQTKDLLKIVL